MKHFLYYLFPACMMLTACQAEETGPIVPNEETPPEFPTLQIAKAQPVTDEVNSIEVDNILKTVFKNEPKARSEAYDVSLLTDAEGQPRIIRVNYANDGGFALISAVKTYEPIIAYAPEGNFPDPEDLRAPLDGMIGTAMKDIAASKDLPADSLQKIAMQWRMFEQGTFGLTAPKSRDTDEEESIRRFHIMMSYINDWQQQGYRVYELGAYNYPLADCDRMRAMAESSIYPMYLDDYLTLSVVVEKDFGTYKGNGHCLKTNWKLENGFNQSFPYRYEDHTRHIPVGCGPLAVGQIMYYFRHPSNFNWDNMSIEGPGNKVTSDFLLDVYNKCKGEYTPYAGGGSYTTHANRIAALKEYGYSCESISGSMINETSLLENSPAIIASSFNNNDTYGHAWIIEGGKLIETHMDVELWTFTGDSSFSRIYTERLNETRNCLFYANWGLDIEPNGFYRFDDLIPRKEYVTSNTLRDAIINIKPKI